MSKEMNDTFWMFPFNETGKEVSNKGHKLSGDIFGLPFDLFYYTVDGINLLIDEMTGMVVWGEANQNIEDIDEFFKENLTKNVIDNINAVHNQCLKNGILLTHCTKKISYIYSKQNLVSNGSKQIKDALTKYNFLEYFKQMLFCKDFGQQTVSSNSILIAPQHYIIPKAHKEDIVDLQKIGVVKIQNVPTIHVLKMQDILRRGFGSYVTVFYIDKFLFGYYIHDSNVLIIPDITKSTETKWFEGIWEFLKKNYLKKRKTPLKDFEITVGCDPEFELYNSENRLMIGEDLNADGRLQRKIGADGHGKQLELRPEPSSDPKEVIEDLSNLFSAVSHLRVDAKGDKEPLGGHIHIGMSSVSNNGKLIATQTVVDMLDTFVGKHTQQLSGKARGGYGKLGDNRDQPWGFEYRTPPAGVFATKEMAYITMKLMKNLVETIMKKDITIEYPIDEKDLYPFLTKEEAKYYMDFPKLFKSLDTENIGKYWTDKTSQPIEVKFFDKWDEAVKVKYKTALKDTIVDGSTVLCLYGLKGPKAAGVETLGTSVPHPRGVHCEEGIAVGLPKACRTEGQYSDAIIKDIKRKISGVNGVTVPRVTSILFSEEMIGCDVTADIRDDEPVLLRGGAEAVTTRAYNDDIEYDDEEY